MADSDSSEIILITDIDWPHLDIELAHLENLGYPVVLADSSDEETLRALAPRAVIIMVCFAQVSAEVIARASKLRAILRWGVGIDNIDVEAASHRDIPVYNVPDYCVGEVADHALMLMLALYRQLPQQERVVASGGWAMPHSMPTRLEGQTLGLIGMGRTGQALARRAHALGMTVVYTSSKRDLPDDIQAAYRPDLAQVLAEADCVSLHVPLTDTTRSLINATTLALMKPSAFLINIARGGLVDTEALTTALSTNVIAGAGIDVTEPEPLPADHPLRFVDSCILTPHFAYRSSEAIIELRERLAEAAAHVLKGHALPENLVSRVLWITSGTT